MMFSTLMKLKKIRWVVWVVLSAIFFIIFSYYYGFNDRHKPEQCLRRGLICKFPHGFNGKNELSEPLQSILPELFEGLVLAEKDGSFSGAMATRWENIEEKDWIFFIDGKAQWSDGHRVSAEDFVVSVHRLFKRAQDNPLLSQKLKRLCRYSLPLLNAQQVLEKSASVEDLGIKYIARSNAVMVQLESSRRPDLVLSALSQPYFLFQSKNYPDIFKSEPTQWVVNGPFVMDMGPIELDNESSALGGQRIFLKKNLKYRHQHQVKLSEITYIIFPSSEKCRQGWENQEIDIFFPESDERSLSELYSNLWWSGAHSFWEIVPNHHHPALKKKAIREILAQIFDRPAMVSACEVPGASERYGIVSISKRIANFDPIWVNDTWQQKIDFIREQLEQLRYSSQHPLKISCIYSHSPSNFLDSCHHFLDSLPEVCVEFIALDAAEQLNRTDSANFDLCLREVQTEDYLPALRYFRLIEGDEDNIGQCEEFLTPEILFDFIANSTSVAYDARFYRMVETKFFRSYPTIPLMVEPKYAVIRSCVGGVPLSKKDPSGRLLSKNLYIIPAHHVPSSEIKKSQMDSFCHKKQDHTIEEEAFLFFW